MAAEGLVPVEGLGRRWGGTSSSSVPVPLLACDGHCDAAQYAAGHPSPLHWHSYLNFSPPHSNASFCWSAAPSHRRSHSRSHSLQHSAFSPAHVPKSPATTFIIQRAVCEAFSLLPSQGYPIRSGAPRQERGGQSARGESAPAPSTTHFSDAAEDTSAACPPPSTASDTARSRPPFKIAHRLTTRTPRVAAPLSTRVQIWDALPSVSASSSETSLLLTADESSAPTIASIFGVGTTSIRDQIKS